MDALDGQHEKLLSRFIRFAFEYMRLKHYLYYLKKNEF